MTDLEQERWNLDQIQRMTEDYSEATGLASVIVQARGVPVAAPCAFTEFCKAMRSDPVRAKLCESCDAHGGLQSLIEQSPRIYRCHAGLVDFTVPMVDGDKYLGAIASGQVRQSGDGDQPPYLTNGSEWHDDPELFEMYNQIPVYSSRRIMAASETLLGLSKSAGVTRECPIISLPTKAGSPAAEAVKSERSQPQFQLVPPPARSDDDPEPEPSSEHHAELCEALAAENLDEAFSVASMMLDEAFASHGDLRDHLAAIEETIVSVSSDCAPRVTGHLSELVKAQQRARTTTNNRYQCQLYVERLVTMVLDEITHSRPQRRPDLRDLLNEIAKHPSHPYTLTEASEMLHWSPGHFSKLFKSVTGCTFVSYIATRRVWRARLMLAFTQTPVRRIAADLGFNQVNYFSRVFRSYTGMTPSEYRRQHSTRNGGPNSASLSAHHDSLLRA
ncbi:PocR ligand-binding domain-containing protein [Propionimicrobium sp. PCR01-08-3]|uniref:PocR ligand-binding domain-containing protein n=1 Tax=Propionimicrobium sp. PCR01-08-3 TaxID=3052086 RepID=UPI00255CECC5|nr:PocR ligand-binding domain-containing protein [Propionimicrobium sp. PCR01-08-3]WIY84046.1 PocR ligand-binding domain-containing protein [Propionimicrobium sp. PCR01-08-3]